MAFAYGSSSSFDGLHRCPAAGSYGPCTRYPYRWPGCTAGRYACQTNPSTSVNWTSCSDPSSPISARSTCSSNLREQREVRTGAVVRGSEGIGTTRPFLHPMTVATPNPRPITVVCFHAMNSPDRPGERFPARPDNGHPGGVLAASSNRRQPPDDAGCRRSPTSVVSPVSRSATRTPTPAPATASVTSVGWSEKLCRAITVRPRTRERCASTAGDVVLEHRVGPPGQLGALAVALGQQLASSTAASRGRAAGRPR